MQHLLGIDLGTTGLKAAIFDTRGQLRGRGYERCRPLPSAGGEAEHDPDDWWSACCTAVAQALGESGLAPDAVRAVGLSGFHHCPVFLRADGQPARPTIVTHDRRLHSSWSALAASGVLQEMTRISQSMISPGHFPSIYHFVRQHDPEALVGTAHLLLAKDYLRFRLTGRIGTEICDATGTNLIRMPERTWSPELCALAGVNPATLPAIGMSSEVCGEVTAQAAGATGIPAGTPVVYGGGDSHCALLGMGVRCSGDAGLLLGTNGTLRAVFAGPAAHPRLKVWTQEHVVPGMFTVSASTLSGASVLEWFVRTFCPDLMRADGEIDSTAVDRLVGGIAAGSDGLVCHPYLFGERSPFLDPAARARFSGIGAQHTRAHFLRSVLEGVACCIADCFRLIEEVAATRGEAPGRIRVGGGGSRLQAWPPIIAGVLNRPVTVVDQAEAGCLGAAMLAGIGIGAFCDAAEAIDSCVRPGTPVAPEEGVTAQYAELFERFSRWKEAAVEQEG